MKESIMKELSIEDMTPVAGGKLSQVQKENLLNAIAELKKLGRSRDDVLRFFWHAGDEVYEFVSANC